MIQAVNKHQGLLRASVANIGQDHRLGANEAPPAIISIFLGAELEKAFESIASGEGDPHTPGVGSSGSARRCCRRCRCTAATATGPRRSPSPATSSSSARSGRACRSRFPNTVLNTIVAEAIDELADKLEAKLPTAATSPRRVAEVVKDSYAANKRILFGGDNYAEEWHAEAEQRGLKNLRTTPDALPEVLAEHDRRGVREVRGALRARARVPLRGLGRAVRRSRQHRGGDRRVDRPDDAAAGGAALPRAARGGRASAALPTEMRALVEEFVDAIAELEEANDYPDGVEGLELAEYARDNQLAAMAEVREVADKLEKVVADDLWPLPKYSEILFIK